MDEPMKTWIHLNRFRVFILLGILLTLTGGSHGLAAEIRISGTGSALPSIEKVAAAFQQKHKEINLRVIYPAMGSGGSIRALKSKEIDIALSSRPLQSKDLNWGEPGIAYARTPFIFAVHQSNPYHNLTSDELAKIYGRETLNWPDGKRLRLVLRPPRDSDTSLIRSISPKISKALDHTLNDSHIKFAITDIDSANRVEKISGAIGTMTLALIRSQSRKLKPLSINGVVPSIANMNLGSYPYKKTFYIITRKDAGEEIYAFVDFLKSPKGALILSKTGNQPLPEK
jgi:phosphate transport system substrate-binding protein